ncbi:Uncharacterised protein [Mycobacteroides abscessus subsp. abscessus]|nr:Uncharacterised protein [Mycobacteroides abscessus subsp. abscessus]
MFDRVFENTCPPDVSVGIGQQGLASQHRGDPVELTATSVVTPLGHHQQVDGKVAALGPSFRLREQQPLPRLHHHERRWLVDAEHRRHRLRHRLDRLAVLFPRVEQVAGLGVEQIVDRLHRVRLQKQRARHAGQLRIWQP